MGLENSKAVHIIDLDISTSHGTQQRIKYSEKKKD